MNARAIIKQVTASGARFILDGDRVGIDRLVPAELLELARQHKEAIRGELAATQARLKSAGLAQLVQAARGLPATLDELAEFFSDDLEDFGTGVVKPEGIRQACEWVVFRHWGRHPYWDRSDRKPKPPPLRDALEANNKRLLDAIGKTK